MLSKYVALASALAVAVSADTQTMWGQCGGIGWQGPTDCPSGSVCTYGNDWYSQCLPGDCDDGGDDSSSSTSAPAPTTSAYSPPPPTSSAAPAPSSSPSGGGSSGSGTTYKASFTQYGSTDSWGSGNCNVDTTACGFFTSPGYSAAVSQNIFGVGPGAGAGPACGTCWKLTPQTDSSGSPLSGAGSIVVQVTNLCPAQGNPLCSQSGTSGTNQYGANVNFDTCIDSGASAALFGSSGTELALGTAEQVDCSEWSGSVSH